MLSHSAIPDPSPPHASSTSKRELTRFDKMAPTSRFSRNQKHAILGSVLGTGQRNATAMPCQYYANQWTQLCQSAAS